jgi:hypothetical protein
MKTSACRSEETLQGPDPLRSLAAKRADPDADTSAWEREIDERVARLYGLTDEEMARIEEDGPR